MMLIFFGCATDSGYKQAFSEQTALSDNTKSYVYPVSQTMKAVKMTLINQGFHLDTAVSSADTIKASRIMQDEDNKDISYNIQVSVVVAEGMTGTSSSISLAATQQTILHKEWHTWWHLLWIIPVIPTGTEHQTVVTKEGNITDGAFYRDFFASVEKSLPISAPPSSSAS
jgi:hypothetical protein